VEALAAAPQVGVPKVRRVAVRRLAARLEATTTGSSMDGSTTGGAGANPNSTMSPSGNSLRSELLTKRFNPDTDRARLGHEGGKRNSWF
jgi:hypothetical protein